MASTRIIEQDHGTYAGLVTHHHNGYYAGDFSRRGPLLASADTALRDGLAGSRVAATGHGIRSWTNETLAQPRAAVASELRPSALTGR